MLKQLIISPAICLIIAENRRKGEKMTEKSFICNVIHDNPDKWEEIMEKKNIKIKREGDLAIVKPHTT